MGVASLHLHSTHVVHVISVCKVHEVNSGMHRSCRLYNAEVRRGDTNAATIMNWVLIEKYMC